MLLGMHETLDIGVQTVSQGTHKTLDADPSSEDKNTEP